MTIICTARHASAHFTWSRKDKTATTFASDLGRAGPLFTPIYDDACDVGFGIVGEGPTNPVATFYVERTDRDDEGDLRFWVLAPTPETLRAMPVLEGYKVTVFNT